MTTETIKTTYPSDTEAEYHESTERLANELLAEYTPQQIAIIAAQHMIYVDLLKASADAAKAASVAKDQLFQVQEQRLLLSIEESKKKLTPRQAAQFAKIAIRASESAEGRRRSDLRHDKPGGSREKRDAMRAAWASGKYSSRDICAEEECAALGMSFSAARKALRNTPDPG